MLLYKITLAVFIFTLIFQLALSNYYKDRPDLLVKASTEGKFNLLTISGFLIVTMVILAIASIVFFIVTTVSNGKPTEAESASIKMEVLASERPPINYNILPYYGMTDEDIAEEIRLGEMELLAQLVHAEAGNQDLEGKRLVVDVVLNRVRSDQFPDTVEEVIMQDSQFSVIKDGGFDRAAWHMEEIDYEAVRLEYEDQNNYEVLYFGVDKPAYATHFFKCQDHWFGW